VKVARVRAKKFGVIVAKPEDLVDAPNRIWGAKVEAAATSNDITLVRPKWMT
jgi:hypothetical protein